MQFTTLLSVGFMVMAEYYQVFLDKIYSKKHAQSSFEHKVCWDPTVRNLTTRNEVSENGGK